MTALYVKWLAAGLLGGLGCGLAGFVLVSMNLPFMGVCLAHAAMAGAVLAYFIGAPPEVMALVFALLAAGLLGPLADRMRTQANTLMSILFSLTLGLAFLGIGLLRGQRSEVLGLMWGNLLLVRYLDVWALGGALLLLGGFMLTLRREIMAVLFDRALARAGGIPANALYYVLLALCGTTVTVNLNVVGGLMLYSLLTQPAATALRLTRHTGTAMALSALLGACAAVGGLALSLTLDWPAGASIVVFSSALYIAGVALTSRAEPGTMRA